MRPDVTVLHDSPSGLRSSYDLAIVGASVAGIRALETVLQRDQRASVLVVDQDVDRPYDKPPLSKGVLSGAVSTESLEFKPTAYWESPQLDALLGHRVDGLGNDRALSVGGRRIAASAVILAPGCRTRFLPNIALELQQGLRTLEDARTIRASLRGYPEVIVGAGFIGLEVASSLRDQGLDVHVIEILDLPMSGALGETASRWIADLASSHGVELHMGTHITSADRNPDGSLCLQLGSGRALTCRRILTGIGVIPNTEWLDGSGVSVKNGIECDHFLHTTVEGVFAAGDVARFPSPRGDGPIRIEHWTTASDLGRAAGTNAVAWLRGISMTPCRPIPYAWSDQFGVKLQTAGWLGGADDVIVHEATSTSLYVEYFREGALSGVLGVGNARRVMAVRAELLKQFG